MTIYDLTNALWRHRKAILISFAVLFVVIFIMSFTVRDGRLAWRGGEKWESGVQMSVVARGTESLGTTDPRSGQLEDAAKLYVGILASDQAAIEIGEAAGYSLSESVDASVSGGSALINATVIGPSREMAIEAALASFDFLEKQLTRPLTTTDLPVTPKALPVLELDQPFDSTMTINLSESLDAVSSEIFIEAEPGTGDASLVLPVARSAGESTSTRTTLAPVMSVILSLQDAQGTPIDSLRIAPIALSGTTSVVPALIVKFGGLSIVPDTDEDGEPTWQLRESSISTEWVDGEALLTENPTVPLEVDIALLTNEPGAHSIGGRRGPIVAFAVFLVGAIAIATVVIVVESWSSERRAAMAATDGSTPEESAQQDSVSEAPEPVVVVSDATAPPGEPAAEQSKPASDTTAPKTEAETKPKAKPQRPTKQSKNQ